MFEALSDPVNDPILQLGVAFRQDTNASKADLGIGVFKDELGHTPIMRAVYEAEVLQTTARESKAYLTFAGDEAFNSLVLKLALGDDFPIDERARAIQTPGGGGAVRLLCETVKLAKPSSRIWISNPTWVNHVPIASYVGLEVERYRYLGSDQQVDFAAMMEDLGSAKDGDVVLLHGCCHNPTGADMTLSQWKELTEFVRTRNLVPFIDLAYQGFGAGVDEDAAGLRYLANACPEILLSVSCSKNFGIYRDRVGIAAVIAESSSTADKARGNLLSLARVNYSFPPHHGAALVRRILSTSDLALGWRDELTEMRQRVQRNRRRLSQMLREVTQDSRFDFVEDHKGMFSLLGFTGEQVKTLRQKHSVYIPPDSRLNMASLYDSNIEYVARAIGIVALGEK